MSAAPMAGHLTEAGAGSSFGHVPSTTCGRRSRELTVARPYFEQSSAVVIHRHCAGFDQPTPIGAPRFHAETWDPGPVRCLDVPHRVACRHHVFWSQARPIQCDREPIGSRLGVVDFLAVDDLIDDVVAPERSEECSQVLFVRRRNDDHPNVPFGQGP